jgi:hypothetical protein
MKKILLSAVTILMSIVSMAQLSIGIQAGSSWSKTSFPKEQDVTYSSKPVLAPTGGIVVWMDLGQQFSIMSSLNYIQKGMKAKAVVTGTGQTAEITQDLYFHYLELPVQAVFKQKLGGTDLFIGVGPSLGYGFGGRSKTTAIGSAFPGGKLEYSGDPFKKSEAIEEPFKRIDISASAGIGLKFSNHMFISLDYLQGLNNISQDKEGGKYSNRTFSLRVGYFLGKRS